MAESVTVPASLAERAKEYVVIKLRIRDLEQEVERLKKDAAPIEEELLERFAQEGIQNVTFAGLGTAFLRSQLWAGAAKLESGDSDWPTTIEALKAAGLGAFVHEACSTQTLSAWARELERDDETGEPILPPEMEGKISLNTKWEVRVNRASK